MRFTVIPSRISTSYAFSSSTSGTSSAPQPSDGQVAGTPRPAPRLLDMGDPERPSRSFHHVDGRDRSRRRCAPPAHRTHCVGQIHKQTARHQRQSCQTAKTPTIISRWLAISEPQEVSAGTPRAGIDPEEDCRPRGTCEGVCRGDGGDGYDDSIAMLLAMDEARLLSSELPKIHRTVLSGRRHRSHPGRRRGQHDLRHCHDAQRPSSLVRNAAPGQVNSGIEQKREERAATFLAPDLAVASPKKPSRARRMPANLPFAHGPRQHSRAILSVDGRRLPDGSWTSYGKAKPTLGVPYDTNPRHLHALPALSCLIPATTTRRVPSGNQAARRFPWPGLRQSPSSLEHTEGRIPPKIPEGVRNAPRPCAAGATIGTRSCAGTGFPRRRREYVRVIRKKADRLRQCLPGSSC